MSRSRWLLMLGALVVLGAAALSVQGIKQPVEDEPPGERSIDVGFARDMGIHHAQAVTLADLVRDRTDDEEIRRLAGDIAHTQQAQIGEMRGWLDAWGRPPSTVRPQMEWMGHGLAPGERMPGMASDAEVAQLTAARGQAAEVLFLELMIRHHQGGRHMAELAERSADESFVRALARGMIESQTAEVRYMQDLLRARGVRYGDEPGNPSDERNDDTPPVSA
jgi:uncharacterized protein (DUF305 family)